MHPESRTRKQSFFQPQRNNSINTLKLSNARDWRAQACRLEQALFFPSFPVANTLAAMIRIAEKAQPRIDTRRGQ
ncbi:hypothetical protein LJR234_002335 [Mesorhizobium amorphae]|jgi:hypothetical protein|uniref:hypothetical protein n=1 Tax=Mesorhizobium amorphae TaxID=71433 RepID=UPI003ED0681D